MAVRLIEKDSTIIFEENGEEIYAIPVAWLNEKRERSSEWIEHLEGVLWITTDLLYQLAKKIQEHCPDNDFDWQEIFEDVEFGDYVDSSYELKKLFDTQKKGWADSFKDRVEFGQTTHEKEVSEAVTSIVKDKLKKYGLEDTH